MIKLSVLLIFFFLFMATTAYATPNITITSPQSTYEVGDTFNVTITLYSDGSYAGWKFNELNYPASKLELLNSTVDAFWTMNDSGIIHNNLGILEDAQGGVFLSEIPDTIVLLNLKFKVIDDGSITITSDTSELFYVENASNADHTLQSLTITVPDSDPPHNGGNGDNGGGNGGVTPPTPPDSDGDGIPDAEDICPGHDDNIDSDNDTIPDGCDDTPNGDPEPPVNETEPPVNDTSDFQAVITFVNKTYIVGEKVDFSAKQSTGNIHFYHWEFGDGTAVEKLIKTNHAYEKQGIYQVTLTISDNDGNTSQAFVNISINPKPYVPPPEPKIEEDYTLGAIILISGILIFLVFFVRFRKQGLI